MTPPRRHLAREVILLTRRCMERRHFLRPDPYINQVTAFELGKATERHGQVIHAAVFMSNHKHSVVTDTNGERSRFMQDSMSGIARSRNRDLDRRGHFWGAGSYGDTVLLDRDAIERKILYVLLNPVRAGLVKRAEDWPGFKILPRQWGKTIRVEKPGRFYGRKSPEVVEFTPMPPPGFEEMSLEEVIAHFEELLRLAEDEIASLREEMGLSVCGPAKVQELDPGSSPATPDQRGKINPRFATRNRALLIQAIEAYRGFYDDYKKARLRWLKGAKNIVFPCGTVALRRRAPIRCAPQNMGEPGVFLLT